MTAARFPVSQRVIVNGAGTSSAFRPFHQHTGTVVRSKSNGQVVVQLDRWPAGVARYYHVLDERANWIVLNRSELGALTPIESEGTAGEASS